MFLPSNIVPNQVRISAFHKASSCFHNGTIHPQISPISILAIQTDGAWATVFEPHFDVERTALAVPVRKSFSILRHLGFFAHVQNPGLWPAVKMLTFLAQQSLVSSVPEALFGPLGVEFMPSDQVIEKTAKKNRTPILFSLPIFPVFPFFSSGIVDCFGMFG